MPHTYTLHTCSYVRTAVCIIMGTKGLSQWAIWGGHFHLMKHDHTIPCHQTVYLSINRHNAKTNTHITGPWVSAIHTGKLTQPWKKGPGCWAPPPPLPTEITYRNNGTHYSCVPIILSLPNREGVLGEPDTCPITGLSVATANDHRPGAQVTALNNNNRSYLTASAA